MIIYYHSLILFLIFFISICYSLNGIAGTHSGKVVFTKGMVTSSIENQPIKILGRGDKLNTGDLISTGDNSKAIIKLIDGSQISLIANTEFKVKLLSLKENQQKADLQLLKGGIRAITGLINKHKNDNFRLITPVASIGIRGTDFTTYLCKSHCDENNIQSVNKRKIIKIDTVVKARVLVKKGEIKAKNSKGDIRILYKESPLYEGDILITADKSIAVIVFKDNSRITVQENTEIDIKNYSFKPKKPTQNHAAFKLLKGSMRLLTGEIGKINRDKYTILTPTSSIGIRGTGFDLAYTNPTYLYLWDGVVNFVYPKGVIRVEKGKSYFLADKNAKPLLIKNIPKKFQSGPRPDNKEISKQIDLLYLFGSRDMDGDPGLYLYVKGGEIEAENEKVRLNLGTGETGYVGEKIAYRITEIPEFLLDQFIPPDADKQTLQRLTIMPDLFDDITYRDDGNICKIMSEFADE